MKIFIVKKDANCPACTHDVTLYALANSQDHADELFKSEDAGMCSLCLVDLLREGNYEIKGGK